MKAIVVIPFVGAPDGEIYPKEFADGDIVTGKLAEVAVAEGWAEEAQAEQAEEAQAKSKK